MAPSATDYTPDVRSRGNRLRARTKHEADQIHAIVNTCPLLHVSYNRPPPPDSDPLDSFPTTLPMLGNLATYGTDDEPHIYLHGSSSAHLFKLANTPLCISATLLDGYVLSLSPFHNSCNYRSAVCFGRGKPVTDPEELLFALHLITNATVPERWENSRTEPTKAELTASAVLKVRVETASCKTRTGGADDDREDLKNAELAGRTWTGVVPAYQVLGEPVAGETNRVERCPEYLVDWVADANGMAEQAAVDAAVEG